MTTCKHGDALSDDGYLIRQLIVGGFRESNIRFKHSELEIAHHGFLPIPAGCQRKREEAERYDESLRRL